MILGCIQNLGRALLVIGVLLAIVVVNAQGFVEEWDETEIASSLSTISEDEMRSFEEQVRCASPSDAADMLEDLARTYNLNLEARPDSHIQDNSIQLGSSEILPEEGIDSRLLEEAATISDDQYISVIFQFDQQPSLGDWIELYRMGAKGSFSEKVGVAAYILALPAGSIIQAHEMANRRWLGYYAPSVKLVEEWQGVNAALVSPVDCDRDSYRGEMSDIGARVLWYDAEINKYFVEMSSSEAKRLAELWWVQRIVFMPIAEPEGSGEGIKALAEDVGEKFLPQDSRSLCGALAIWPYRTGLGITVGIHDYSPWSGHPDLAGAFTADSDTGTAEDHGIHVAGIIAARDSGAVDISGDNDCRGMAPSAELCAVEMGTPWVTYPTAFQRFADNNVVVSNHSYWFGDFDYDAHTEQFDEYADDNGAIIVKSAGNQEHADITNPGTGKNVLSVGGIRYLTDDGRGKSIGGVADYSSFGPAQGRLKPDLVAPGGQWSRLDVDEDDEYGVVSLDEDPPNNTGADAWPESDRYVSKSGTSMAAPHVTGSIALMLETYPTASDEGIKARLIGTTIPLDDGGANAASGYASTEVGYGLVNAYNAAGRRYVDESETLLWQSGTVDWTDLEDELRFDVPANTERLIAVLCYNDEPGGAGHLVHELGFELDDGTLTHAHELPAGVTEESAVRKLIVEDPVSGEWTATVSFDNASALDTEDYSVFVYALYKMPSLAVTNLDTPTSSIAAGQAFSVSLTVENDGGWIAAGVTAMIEAVSSGFDGQVDYTKNVGNLMSEGASADISFQLLAPALPGEYTLRIHVDAVNRGIVAPQPIERVIHVVGDSGVDTALVIDRSGSMDPADKLPVAKNAARYFVDSSRIGDQIAISAFDHNGTLVHALTEIVDADPSSTEKAAIKVDIDAIVTGGSTDFGAGLQIAYDQLNGSGKQQPKYAVLMSDGHHNDGTYAGQVTSFANEGWPIHTIAFGANADEARLSQIASDTNGLFYRAESTNLIQIYDLIRADMTAQAILAVLQWFLQQGQQIGQLIPPISPGTTLLHFLLTWGGSDVDLILIMPDGTEITPADAAANPDITYYKTGTYLFYTINNPAPGTWGVRITGTDLPDPEIVTLSVSASTHVVTSFYGFQGAFQPNDPIPIAVQVRETDGTPILGATLSADVTPPGSVATTMQLFDDGAHGDGLAGDGVYGNTFTNTSKEGFYGIYVSIDGTYSGGAFSQGIIGTVLVGAPSPTYTTVMWTEDFTYTNQAAMVAAGWSLNALWGLVEETQMTPFGYTDLGEFPSATQAAYFGDTGSGAYGAGTTPAALSPTQRSARIRPQQANYPHGELTSPGIPVGGQAAVEVTFEYFREVECYEQGTYDKTYVQASFDSGSWETIWLLDSRDCAIPRAWIGPDSVVPDEARPHAVVAVPSGAASMQLRFVFDAVDNYANNYLGWLIDDVCVRSAGGAELRIDPQSLSEGLVNQAFDATLNAVGGTPEYGWRVIEKPDWLTVTPNAATCTLTGTPTAAGTYRLCVGVGDSRGQSAEICYEIRIEDVLLGGTVFFDDFEGGQPNPWNPEGLWHLADNTGCISPPYASATHAYYYGRDATCNYATSGPNQGTLESPAIDISGVSAGSPLTIGWRQYRNVELYDKGSYDRTLVEVSLNGGGTWRDIWFSDCNDPCDTNWQSLEIATDLTGAPLVVPANATDMYIRYTFNSVDVYGNDYVGWLIDDVKVIQQLAGTLDLAITTECDDLGMLTVGDVYSVQLAVQGGVPPYTWSMSCNIPGINLDPNTGQLAGTPTQAGQFCCDFTVQDATSAQETLHCCLTVIPAASACVLLDEYFDDPQGWTKTGLWTFDGNGQCIDCNGIFGYFAYYGIPAACDFDTGLRTTGTLTSPTVALADGIEGLVIELDSFRHVEDGKSTLDRTRLEIRFNGGGWQTIWSKTAADPSPECEHVQLGKYLPKTAESFQLRFVFDSWDALFNQFPGWAVDNLRVFSSECKPDVNLQSLSPMSLEESDDQVLQVLNVPNPVRDVNTTRFHVRSPEVEMMRIQIFDLDQNLVFEEEVEGNELIWHTMDRYGEYLANGVYFYRALVKIGEEWITTSIQKLIILR